ncbi:Do family serine endopeptidase [Buchnera aphidicola (Formosaphis micheliae)]|uniref:Do family serine endopeptidase n=1 Tax=Buchnera aphidicola TaxID=9 RepID=UPI0031B87FC8
MKKISTIAFRLTCVIIVFFLSSGVSLENVVPISKMSSKVYLPSLAPMLERVMPSVVSINIEGTNVPKKTCLTNNVYKSFSDSSSPLYLNTSLFYKSIMFKKKYKIKPVQNYFKALGSGVIINAKQGYVVTNNHVIDHADKIIVFLHDGTRYEARIVGKDEKSDIALLQLKNIKNLIDIQLGNSDLLRVGDYTIAIGNPYGLGETVTSGIISALGRSGLNIRNYENFIQTDAAINRGNSGGALINLKGELIGINTAILAPEEGNIGIGFAIPGNMIKNITQQMILYGKVKRGELGIIGTELSHQLGQVLRLNANRGAFVNQVIPNSSADVAGIEAGDVIVSFNRKPIYSFAVLRAEISSIPEHTQFELGLLRNNKMKYVSVLLKKNKLNIIASKNLCSKISGAILSNFNQSHGVHVDSIKLYSAAAHFGFKENDIIVGVNKHIVLNLDTLQNIFEHHSSVLIFHIIRGHTNIYLVVQ